MKKKLLSAMLVATMVLSVTACGKTSSDSSTTDTTTAATATSDITSYASQLATDQDNYAQYVTLGEYKGVGITVDRSTLDVTDSDVDDFIQSLLQNNATTEKVTEGTTKSGDSIVLDYSGLLDGVAFSGGTATDASYTVGSGKFITDLDQGLIGLEVGKEYDIPCTFPSDYSSSDLAGKDVIFRVTVTAINQSTLPEYNDEFVQSVASQYNSDATTVADFNTFAKQYLQDQAQTTFETNRNNAVWTAVSSNCSVSGYIDSEVQSLEDTINSNIQSEYAAYGSYYGISDFDSYLSQVYGFNSEDEFLEQANELAKSYLDEKMILTMIAKQENITVTDDEVATEGASWASQYGYDSYDDILSEYGNEVNQEVGYSVLSTKVLNFLGENAVEQ